MESEVVMLSYFQDTVSGIEAKLATIDPSEPRARKRMALATARLGARLYSPDHPVAWCGVLVPFDLLNAIGLTSCYVEFVGTTLAGSGAAPLMLETAEQSGFAPESCSYHRTVLGAMAQGLIPAPELVIATSAPCSGGLAVLEEVARHFGKPLFTLHIPYLKDDQAVAYLAVQLREMVDFVATASGRRLDPERLTEAIERTNRARAAMVELYDIARSTPYPGRPTDLINFALSIALFFGTDEAVEIAETYRDELARNREAGTSEQERLRLLWLQNRIQFRNPLVQILQAEHQAAVVVDELNAVTWEPVDPDDPFTGLARYMLSIPLCGAVEYRAKHLRKLARDYQVDGAINPCHWGCRQGAGVRGLLERELKDEGIGVLNLEVDCVDQRAFSEGQVRTRMQAFLEMLAERSAR
jgi:benzoyl-CoA reductase/2-hydroxyglutaryl-CoA dehydratase subunit BcrC/BadD/HgdB